MIEELAEKRVQFQLQLGKMRRGLWRGLLRALTPAHCLICHAPVQDQPDLCVECWQKMRFLEEPVCDVMGTAFAYDQGEAAFPMRAITTLGDAKLAVEIIDDY